MKKSLIVSLILFAMPALVLANCGNGGDNGEGCEGGSTGATGPAGPQGPVGPQGPQGNTGSSGSNGQPGTAGQNGSNGTPGTPGTPGTAGQNGSNGTNGKNGATGAQGPQGPGHVDPRMNEARLGIDTAIRLYDGKRVQLQIYNVWSPALHPGEDTLGDGQNLQFGVRFVYKLGTSYEERQNKALKAQLDALQAMVAKLQ